MSQKSHLYLRYGDIVVLQSTTEGFLSNNSFVDDSLCTHPLAEQAESFPPNIPACRFEITRCNCYTAYKLLEKSLRTQGRSISSLTDNTHDEDAQTVRMYENWQNECQTNADQNALMAGREVVYGAQIQLRHVSTGRFVCVNKVRASSEPKHRHVSLAEDSGAPLGVLGVAYTTLTLFIRLTPALLLWGCRLLPRNSPLLWGCRLLLSLLLALRALHSLSTRV